MAGINLGGSYYYNGFTGTAQQHAERQRKNRNQEPFDAAAPSAGAANTVRRQVDPNLDFDIGPTGNLSYNNQSAQQRQTAELNAKLQREADERRAAERRSLLGLASKGGGGSAPTVQHASVQGSEADARAAAFSRAKDQAGKIARASLTSIAEQIAGRGISGSGIEALRAAGAIGGAGDELQELTRDQLVADNNRAADISDMSYQGGITQRGQDLSARQSYLSLLAGLY
jgi:hypothetical protein